jgi:ribosomal protein S18 acetylase RimI-like enzyme
MSITLARNPSISSASLNELRATAWSGPQTTNWDPILERSLGWIGAFDHQELVGFVNIAWDGGHHAFLLDTTVHRQYQHRGIGASLVREAAALAREHGAEWLHVDYEEDLEPFYAACGFRPTSAALLNLTTSPNRVGA